MVFEKVRDIVSYQLEMDPNTITPQSTLAHDLKADSVDVIEIIMKMEQEFNIEFSFDDLGEIATIGDAVKYIEERILSLIHISRGQARRLAA